MTAPNPNYLKDELAKASFDPMELSLALFGGQEGFARHQAWEKVFAAEPIFDFSNDPFLSRPEKAKISLARALRTVQLMKKHTDIRAAHSPLHGEGGEAIGTISGNHSGITDHYALFVNTLVMQATPEQQREWLMKAINLEIIGTYAQTELGHGTNVRGLETIATFDRATDSFIVNMPTVGARKWWPGALGILATHAVIYARMIVDGKDLGYHAYMVQIRDENHKPLPGVEVGDIGPKMGAPGMDAGYLSLSNVRIPRFNMLAKFQQLSKEGKYTPAPAQLGKIAYATMMKTRVLLALHAAQSLARGCTIVLRYNAFRLQGFKDSKKGVQGGELAIIDYPIQQHRVFPSLAASWALVFGGMQLQAMLDKFDASVKAAGRNVDKVDTSMLPELHASSCGMKSFGTEMCCAGLEEARKCCGGHGYALYSGISQQILDYLPSPTYEGDRIPMALQTARALIGTLMGKVDPVGTFAYLKQDGETTLENPLDVNCLMKFWETIARRTAIAAGERLMEDGANMKPDLAWNANQVILMSAAHAHTMYLLVNAFGAAVTGQMNVQRRTYQANLSANCKAALTRLCLLFGLGRLQEVSPAMHKMSPETAQKVDDAIKQLLAEIRPDALALVECWDIPDRILNSAIARKDGKIYEAVAEFARRNPLNKESFGQEIRQILEPWLNKKYLAGSKL